MGLLVPAAVGLFVEVAPAIACPFTVPSGRARRITGPTARLVASTPMVLLLRGRAVIRPEGGAEAPP